MDNIDGHRVADVIKNKMARYNNWLIKYLNNIFQTSNISKYTYCSLFKHSYFSVGHSVYLNSQNMKLKIGIYNNALSFEKVKDLKKIKKKKTVKNVFIFFS